MKRVGWRAKLDEPVYVFIGKRRCRGTYLGKESRLVAIGFAGVSGSRLVPKLRLTSGRIVYGHECWWIPIRVADELGEAW